MLTSTIIISTFAGEVKLRESGLANHELSTKLVESLARLPETESKYSIILHRDSWMLPPDAEQTAFESLRGNFSDQSIASMHADTGQDSLCIERLDTNDGKLLVLGIVRADKKSNEHAKDLCEPHPKHTWHTVLMRLLSSEFPSNDTMRMGSGDTGSVRSQNRCAWKDNASPAKHFRVRLWSTQEGGDPKFSSSAEQSVGERAQDLEARPLQRASAGHPSKSSMVSGTRYNGLNNPQSRSQMPGFRKNFIGTMPNRTLQQPTGAFISSVPGWPIVYILSPPSQPSTMGPNRWKRGQTPNGSKPPELGTSSAKSKTISAQGGNTAVPVHLDLREIVGSPTSNREPPADSSYRESAFQSKDETPHQLGHSDTNGTQPTDNSHGEHHPEVQSTLTDRSQGDDIRDWLSRLSVCYAETSRR